jgi:TonB family protein
MKPFSVLTFIAGLTVVAHGNSDSVGKQAKQRALYAPYPEYPLAARQRHWTGAGVFICHLRADETVASVNVCRSTGHQMLDQAAMAALRRWRFQPRGHEGGQGTSIFLREPHSRAASDGGGCDPRMSGNSKHRLDDRSTLCQIHKRVNLYRSLASFLPSKRSLRAMELSGTGVHSKPIARKSA